MQVLAFRHAPLEDIGLIRGALERHSIACRYLDLYANPQPVPDLAEVAGLILMGGPMSVNDDLPWLRQEMRAVRDAIQRGIPVLGICLGAQLIARALGAAVYRNPVKEIGWTPLYFAAAAPADPLLSGFSHPETVFQWHGETFDLPDGAEHLAYSDACRNQAFRIHRNVYGFQFHLEVTPEMIEDWCRQDAGCGALREAQAPIDAYANAARLAEVAETVFDRWCGLLGGERLDSICGLKR
ncbi:MAG: type 1 glutamine amidotransferase [Bryobacteraceae bacterium]|jgi:GMP synthase-like glutamine amidotransferase